MSALVCTWLLSLSGAILFFAAGAAYVTRRLARIGLVQREALERELRQRTAERQQLFRELEIERSARVSSEPPPVMEPRAARVLRAEAFDQNPTPPHSRTLAQPLSTTERALQTIVDAETQLGRAKSAVITNQLGLLVAASGANHEYNDALAALGAYLADVGSKTRAILPLRNLRHVVVSDVHDVTVIVRPLATDDPGLALVTLAITPASNANDNRQN
jgi:hypothetical protein